MRAGGGVAELSLLMTMRGSWLTLRDGILRGSRPPFKSAIPSAISAANLAAVSLLTPRVGADNLHRDGDGVPRNRP
jgi:hypothetical protein